MHTFTYRNMPTNVKIHRAPKNATIHSNTPAACHSSRLNMTKNVTLIPAPKRATNELAVHLAVVSFIFPDVGKWKYNKPFPQPPRLQNLINPNNHCQDRANTDSTKITQQQQLVRLMESKGIQDRHQDQRGRRDEAREHRQHRPDSADARMALCISMDAEFVHI